MKKGQSREERAGCVYRGRGSREHVLVKERTWHCFVTESIPEVLHEVIQSHMEAWSHAFEELTNEDVSTHMRKVLPLASVVEVDHRIPGTHSFLFFVFTIRDTSVQFLSHC